MSKAYVEYNPSIHGDFRTSRYRGICRWCETPYYPGDKVNWNPRVKNTCCHAGCYKAYGSPVGIQDPTSNPIEPTPNFVTRTGNPIQLGDEVDLVETPKPSGLPQAIVDAIIPYLEGRLKGLVTKEQVESILDKILGDRILKTVTVIKVERDGDFGLELEDLGLQHKKFELLMKSVRCRVNVWLTGTAGSGKTTAAEEVARALGLPYYFTGCIDTEYKLTGFVDAKGQIVSTAFRKAYINGGVFLFDEVDASLAPALLAFNAALAGKKCAFPDGIFDKHPNFIAIAAANTWGLGATNDFVGRAKLDAAFLNRFPSKIHWDVDEELEMALSKNEAWCKRVQCYRRVIAQKSIKGVMITPRNSIEGAKMLAGGFTLEELEEVNLRNGMTDAQWNDVRMAVKAELGS